MAALATHLTHIHTAAAAVQAALAAAFRGTTRAAAEITAVAAVAGMAIATAQPSVVRGAEARAAMVLCGLFGQGLPAPTPTQTLAICKDNENAFGSYH
jgi:hypothetical protein